ncbi:MAG: hypothetical protein ABSE42_13650 [Bryobacteraceae bacterium]|jgi:hypothetical protein
MTWLIIVGLPIGVYGLHRLALWMETKGWLFYVHKKASPNALGNAAFGIQRIIQPGAGHVLEVRQSRRVRRDDVGGPDEAGAANPKETDT